MQHIASNAPYYCLESNDPRIEVIIDEYAALYEQSHAWLKAMECQLLTSQDKIVFHALVDDRQDKILMLWPLVHSQTRGGRRIASVESCYSTNCGVYFGAELDKFELTRKLLLSVCQRYPWDELRLGPTDNPQVNKAIYSVGLFHKEFAVIGHWYEDQLSEFTAYLAARPSKLKNTIKRKSKKLDKEHDVECKFATNVTEFSSMFSEYQCVYEKSWKGEEASYAFIEQICLAALKDNKLRFANLYIDGKIAASQIWFIHNGVASIFKLAYDPAYRHYSVGSQLTSALCEQVLDRDKCHTIEFGCGDEQYKRDWMTKYHNRYVIQLFNSKTILGNILILKHIYLARVKQAFNKLFRKDE